MYHELAAALLVDGELVGAVEEERFNRIKHGKEADFDNPHQFPERAIRFCLKHAGLTARDIDHVAFSFDPRLRRKQYRAEWWDPRFEETFRLRLGQVRGRRRRASRALARRAISFRAPPSDTCRFGVFPVRLRSRGHSQHRRDRRGGGLDAVEGRGSAYPDRRYVRLSQFARIPVGGVQRLSRLLALRRLEGHGPGSLWQSRGLPSPIPVDPARRQGGLCGSAGIHRLSIGQVRSAGRDVRSAPIHGSRDPAAACRYRRSAAGGDECRGPGARTPPQAQGAARQSVPCRRRRAQLRDQ